MIVDESHQTVPQIRGMYHGDRSRKEVLVAYGFRLPSALDNRPLNFAEWEERVKQVVFVSAWSPVKTSVASRPPSELQQASLSTCFACFSSGFLQMRATTVSQSFGEYHRNPT